MGAFRAAAVLLVLVGSAGQSGPDPGALLKEADRLAWLRAWSAAEPHFLQAQKLFAAREPPTVTELPLAVIKSAPVSCTSLTACSARKEYGEASSRSRGRISTLPLLGPMPFTVIATKRSEAVGPLKMLESTGRGSEATAAPSPSSTLK